MRERLHSELIWRVVGRVVHGHTARGDVGVREFDLVMIDRKADAKAIAAVLLRPEIDWKLVLLRYPYKMDLSREIKE